MPRVRRDLREGVRKPGGIVRYPLDRLRQEVAYIAYHFHWSPDDIMEMPHKQRHAWAKEIGTINERINKSFGS
jgi:hypothetical protein